MMIGTKADRIEPPAERRAGKLILIIIISSCLFFSSIRLCSRVRDHQGADLLLRSDRLTKHTGQICLHATSKHRHHGRYGTMLCHLAIFCRLSVKDTQTRHNLLPLNNTARGCTLQR